VTSDSCWEHAGAHRHPTRLGRLCRRLVDRGPQQVETVNIARRMVDAGSARAVMGNHELNAIAWHTPNPEVPGDFLHSKWTELRRAAGRLSRAVRVHGRSSSLLRLSRSTALRFSQTRPRRRMNAHELRPCPMRSEPAPNGSTGTQVAQLAQHDFGRGRYDADHAPPEKAAHHDECVGSRWERELVTEAW
jgi:hypothetical protein